MMVLNVKNNEYKVKFGYNSFCDTDLMDRTSDLIQIFSSENVENDNDVTGLGKVKDLFCCVRDLLFVGFQKYNPIDTVQDAGNLLDDWREEVKEGEERGIVDLFTKLTEELMNEGFFGELMKKLGETAKKQPKVPQDHNPPKR